MTAEEQLRCIAELFGFDLGIRAGTDIDEFSSDEGLWVAMRQSKDQPDYIEAAPLQPFLAIQIEKLDAAEGINESVMALLGLKVERQNLVEPIIEAARKVIHADRTSVHLEPMRTYLTELAAALDVLTARDERPDDAPHDPSPR